MNKRLIILFLLVFFGFTIQAQELLIPSAHNLKDEVLFSSHSKKLIGTGFFPISYNQANYNLPEKDTVKARNWFVRKLLKEHFVQIEGKDFFLAIDPLLEMNLGFERLQETPYYLYQNTRGAQAIGQVKNIFSFYTAFYENQARFVDYQRDYFASRGEFIPNADGSVYSQSNATIPNGGRTKPFKNTGFDYASAVSYIRLTPVKQLAIQFGNMPRFFGWGYRSMLLSDNAYNFTHLDIDWNITKDLTYTVIRGKQLNLTRKVYSHSVERPFEKKGFGAHYLSYRITPSLVVGLFESTLYLRDEATDYHSVSNYFYLPIIGLPTFAKRGVEKDGMKSLIGLNAAWKFNAQQMIYGQFASDDFKHFEYGFQLGYRIGNPFNIENLHFQIEYNQASSLLYAANNERIAYTHFNLPLAHTLGNGFREMLIRGSYKWKGIYIDAELLYYRANQTMEQKDALFLSKSEETIQNAVNVLNLNVELGYELNPATRLRVYVGGNYRQRTSTADGSINYGVATFGIRSSLCNQYFDF